MTPQKKIYAPVMIVLGTLCLPLSPAWSQVEIKAANSKYVHRNGFREIVIAPIKHGETVLVRITPKNKNLNRFNVQVMSGKKVVKVVKSKQWFRHVQEAKVDIRRLSGRVDILVASPQDRKFRGATYFHVDRRAPTFKNIFVAGHAKRLYSSNPVKLHLDVNTGKDDGNWKRTDYSIEWKLDGKSRVTKGTGTQWKAPKDGLHEIRAKVRDPYFKYSREKTVKVFVDSRDPTVSFSSPKVEKGKMLPLFVGPKQTFVVVAGDPGAKSSGLSNVKLYLDAIPTGEFSKGKLLHTFKGPWRRGFGEKVSKTFVVNWSAGRHEILAVATDQAGNTSSIAKIPVVVRSFRKIRK